MKKKYTIPLHIKLYEDKKRDFKTYKFLRNLFMFLVLLFLYIPLIYIVIFSFNSSSSLTHFDGFSSKWYSEMFENDMLIDAIMNTISCALISTIISTIIGTFGAIGLTHFKKRSRNILMNAANFPVLNPDIVTAIGLLLVFLLFRMQGGYLTMLLAHISFCTPYVIISVYPKLKTLDSNTLEAAMDLGAKPFPAVLRVLIPQLKAAILSAASLAFTMSFDDFVITYFVTGSSINNVSTYLYTVVLRKFKDLTVNAFSTIVIFVIFIIVIVRFILDQRKYANSKLKED